MKRAAQFLPLAVLTGRASAQALDEGTTTITYSVCPSAITTTTTLSSTLTLCPGPYCDGGSGSITVAPNFGGYETGYTTVGPNGESTVYETIYPNTCSTGMQDVTYYITEGCPCSESRPANYVPSGFSTTVVVATTKACDTCAESVTTVTLTTPCSTGPYTNQTGNTPGAPSNIGGTPATADAATSGSATANAAAGAATAPAAGESAAASTGLIGASSSLTAAGAAPEATPARAEDNTTDTGSAAVSSFTGAAQKVDVIGCVASVFLALSVGAAAWIL